MSASPGAPSAPLAWSLAQAHAIAGAHRDAAAPALAVLDALEAAFGDLPDEAAAVVGAALGVGPFEARGLMLFHRDVRDRAGRPHVIRVCRGERCRARGGEAIGERISALLGVPWYGTSEDGRWHFAPVYCQGLCDAGPSACVDDIPFPRLDRIGAEGLVGRLEAIDRGEG